MNVRDIPYELWFRILEYDRSLCKNLLATCVETHFSVVKYNKMNKIKFLSRTDVNYHNIIEYLDLAKGVDNTKIIKYIKI